MFQEGREQITSPFQFPKVLRNTQNNSCVVWCFFVTETVEYHVIDQNSYV